MRVLLSSTVAIPVVFFFNVMTLAFSSALDNHLEKDALVWQTKLRVLPRPVDAIALGDSQIMSALLPGVFQEKAPGQQSLDLFNLGLPSNQPELFSAWAREWDAKLWIVNVSPYLLFKTPVVQTFERLRVQIYQPERGLELRARSHWRPGQILYETLYLMPLMSARAFVRPCILQPQLCPGYLDRAEANRYIKRILDERAGHWVWQDLEDRCLSPDVRQSSAPAVPFEPTIRERTEALRGYQDLIHLARQKQAQLVLVWIPFSPGFLTSGGGALQTAAQDLLARPHWQSLLTGLPVLEPPADLLGPEHFHDLTHLNRCGAEVFSRWLYIELLKISP